MVINIKWDHVAHRGTYKVLVAKHGMSVLYMHEGKLTVIV